MDFAYQGKHPPAKLASMVANSSQVQGYNGWLTDTGCSDHVTLNLSQLSLHQQPVVGNETITVGNGQELPVTHVGHGELKTSTYNFRINNILRVLNLASNLLSVHKLCLQNNAFCYFDAHKFLIQELPSRKILYKGLSKDGVYPIPSSSSLSSSIAFNSTSTVSASHSLKSDALLLWHYRLGHPSSRLLYYALKPFFHSVTLFQIEDCCSSCEYCISAKMHKYPLSKSPIVSTFVLDLVHSDVLGPAPLSSVLGFSYYVIFVDDYARFTWLSLWM